MLRRKHTYVSCPHENDPMLTGTGRIDRHSDRAGIIEKSQITDDPPHRHGSKALRIRNENGSMLEGLYLLPRPQGLPMRRRSPVRGRTANLQHGGMCAGNMLDAGAMIPRLGEAACPALRGRRTILTLLYHSTRPEQKAVLCRRCYDLYMKGGEVLSDTVALHVIRRNLQTIAIDPDHVHRVESEMFRKTKQRLHDDGHMQCWICGTTDDLQVHHRAEWMFANVADWEKVKEFVEEWDPYGYGRLLRNKPLESLDDIRVGLVLCQPHHTGTDHATGSGIGIHNIDFSLWVMQKLALSGAAPLPQRGESIDDVEKRVLQFER